MDDLKQTLKQYYKQLEPTEEFMERLRRLEDETGRAAAPRMHSRRRFLLPIAAMLAVAVAVGGGWRYLKTAMPSNPPAAGPAYSEPPAQPRIPGKPAEKPVDAPPVPDTPAEAADPASEAQSPEAPQAQPADTAPEPTQAAPAPAPEAPKPAEAPAKTDPPKTAEPKPQENPAPPVENPDSPEENPDPPEEDPPVVDPGPPEENPDPPEEIITLSADFFSDGEQDFVSVTNDETGETVTYDMTGLVPAQAPGTAPSPHQSQEESYSFQRSAFGWDFALTITRDADGSAEASAAPIS